MSLNTDVYQFPGFPALGGGPLILRFFIFGEGEARECHGEILLGAPCRQKQVTYRSQLWSASARSCAAHARAASASRTQPTPNHMSNPGHTWRHFVRVQHEIPETRRNLLGGANSEEEDPIWSNMGQLLTNVPSNVGRSRVELGRTRPNLVESGPSCPSRVGHGRRIPATFGGDVDRNWSRKTRSKLGGARARAPNFTTRPPLGEVRAFSLGGPSRSSRGAVAQNILWN